MWQYRLNFWADCDSVQVKLSFHVHWADYALVQEYNVVHGSDSEASAEREIAIYFDESEICDEYQNMAEIVDVRLDD